MAEAKDMPEEDQRQKNKIAELESVIEHLYEKIENVHDDTLEVDAPTQATKKNALLIADSNRRMILPELKDESITWAHADEIFTVEKLEEKNVDGGPMIDEEFNAIYVMLGTNDICRNGKDGIRTAKKLIRVIKDIQENHPNTRVAAVEIPPLKDSRMATERFLFNKTLKASKENEEIKLVQTAEELAEKDLNLILDTDGTHLLQKGGSIVATKLIQDANENTTETAVPQPERKVREQKVNTKWEIPDGAVKYIIGSKGKTIQKLENDHEVTIKLEKQEGNDQTQTVTVTAAMDKNINQARREIEKIVNKYEDDDSKFEGKKEQARTVICRYHQRGGCRRGESCMYSHPSTTTNRGGRDEHERRPSTHNERSRQKSRQEPTRSSHSNRSRSNIAIKRN